MNRRGFLRTALCAAGATVGAMLTGRVEAQTPEPSADPAPDTRKHLLVHASTSIGRNSLRIYDGDDPDAVLCSLLSGISTNKHCLRICDAGIFQREDGLYAEVESEWGGLTSRVRFT